MKKIKATVADYLKNDSKNITSQTLGHCPSFVVDVFFFPIICCSLCDGDWMPLPPDLPLLGHQNVME